MASERENIVKGKAEFVSALDVDNTFVDDLTREELAAIKYGAPYGFYVDFDGDIEEVLGQSKVFLLKLQDEYGLDLNQVRLYFTGGRGCHVELPFHCFLQRVPPAGVAQLPAIFKEIAMGLYVDTMDVRVYSAGRGRMWRTPNVKRANGMYKVPVSVEEFMCATPDTYAAICAIPRPPLSLAPPVFNPKLGLLYMQARDRVERAVKRAKAKKSGSDDAKRFEGEWPGSFRLLLTGEGVKSELGWNQIAIQIASFALALGKTEAQMIEDAHGLIHAHEGDSGRYDNPRKRERELRSQYRYQDGNPSYDWSVGGTRSLYAKGTYSADLDWAGTGHDALPPDDDEDDDGGEDGEAAEGDGNAADEIDPFDQVYFNHTGIYAQTENGPRHICPIGLRNPIALLDKQGQHIGYEFTSYLDGKKKGPGYMTLTHLKTKSSFNDWVNQYSTWQTVTDNYVGRLSDTLRKRTLRGKQMIVTSREGIDLVLYPGAKSIDDLDVIFASPDQCLNPRGRQYRFRGMHDQSGAFKTDLMSAPRLEDTPETREFFDRLWKINTPATVGKVVGWFSAAFLCQIIRHHWQQFPMLQVWGEAGAGKSKTVELFAHMHYHLQTPKKISSAGNTFFPMMAAVTQSASIPVIFEELKPRQMAKYQLDQVQNLMRTNYTGDKVERGGINRDVAASGPVINGYENVAPIMFLGEAVESQSAIYERCVSTPLSKKDREGRSDDFDYVYARRRGQMLGSLGRNLVDAVLAIEPERVRETVSKYHVRFRDRIGRKLYENLSRPWHNHSVVLTGLDLLQDVMGAVFGHRYTQTLDDIKEAVFESAVMNTHQVMSEAAKVLDVLAQLTRVQDTQFRLEKNADYYTDGNHVDIRLRPAYAKYVRYQLSLKQEVLFDNDRAFIEGLRRYEGKDAESVPESPIYRTQYEPLFRFKCAQLLSDGCEPFEP